LPTIVLAFDAPRIKLRARKSNVRLDLVLSSEADYAFQVAVQHSRH
jgi:hypothetical protein